MNFFRKKSSSAGSSGKKKEPTAFERRQTLARKFEEEARMSGAGEEQPSVKPFGLEEDDYIPPPPPEAPAKSAAKKSFKLSSAGGKKAADGDEAEEDVPPPPLGVNKPVDPDYIEFTVVPLLLRAKVAYDQANAYGEALKGLTDLEVKTICSTPMRLIDDLKKLGIKVPPSFEKDLIEDAFWKAAVSNRKSFVYYRKDKDPEPGSAKPSADPVQQTRDRVHTRSSFGAGTLPAVEEDNNANRYKVQTRTKQAESLSKDLGDLVSTLNSLEQQNARKAKGKN